MAKKQKRQKPRGIPGNYRLNQKVQKFQDRRTKRQRTRADRNRAEIRLDLAV